MERASAYAQPTIRSPAFHLTYYKLWYGPQKKDFKLDKERFCMLNL